MDVNIYLLAKNNLNGHDDICIRDVCIEENCSRWQGSQGLNCLVQTQWQSNRTLYLCSASQSIFRIVLLLEGRRDQHLYPPLKYENTEAQWDQIFAQGYTENGTVGLKPYHSFQFHFPRQNTVYICSLKWALLIPWKRSLRCYLVVIRVFKEER